MIKVFATREGLKGKPTASGYIIDNVVKFVALPNVKALGRTIRISRCFPNDQPGQFFFAQVLDVGPHSDCDPYVFQPYTQSMCNPDPDMVPQIRPLAESGISRTWDDGENKETDRKAGNIAGIDLGEAIWNALKMTDNGYVYWEFAD